LASWCLSVRRAMRLSLRLSLVCPLWWNGLQHVQFSPPGPHFPTIFSLNLSMRLVYQTLSESQASATAHIGSRERTHPRVPYSWRLAVGLISVPRFLELVYRKDCRSQALAQRIEQGLDILEGVSGDKRGRNLSLCPFRPAGQRCSRERVWPAPAMSRVSERRRSRGPRKPTLH